MVHLVATLANDADHMPSLLHALRSEVVLPEATVPGLVFGLGYYAEERALIIRKPAELLTARSVFDLAPQVSSTILLACVDPSAPALEQAPPHRFRSWLFGYSGDLAPLKPLRQRILDKLPDFVLHEIGEGAVGGLVFGMFVAELHRAGILNDALSTNASFAQAMQRTTEAVRMLASEVGAASPNAAFVVTNGRVVIASRCGGSLFLKTQEGLESSPFGPADPSLGEFKRFAEGLKRFRAIILTHEVAPGRAGFVEVPDGATLYIDRKLTVSKL